MIDLIFIKTYACPRRQQKHTIRQSSKHKPSRKKKNSEPPLLRFHLLLLARHRFLLRPEYRKDKEEYKSKDTEENNT